MAGKHTAVHNSETARSGGSAPVSQAHIDVDDGSYEYDYQYEDEHQPPEIAALLGGIKHGNKKTPAPTPDGGDGSTGTATAGGDDPDNPDGNESDGELSDDETRKGRLSTLEKVAFGLPNLATSAMLLPTSIHINKFFADSLLVPPGTLALGS